MKRNFMRLLCLSYVVGMVFFAVNYDVIKQKFEKKEDVKTEETASVDDFSDTQYIEGRIKAYTKDLYSMDLNYTFSYGIVNPERLYMTFGAVYEEKVIKPIIKKVVFGVVGEYSAQDCIPNEEKIVSDINQKLIDDLSSEFFTEIWFQMRMDYSDNFEAGIGAKDLVEQKAKDKNLQNVITAKSDPVVAEARDIEAKSIASDSRSLEFYRRMARSAGGWKTVVMSN